MIWLLLGALHYLEAAFMETKGNESTIYGEYLGESPSDAEVEYAQLRHEFFCEEWLREEEEQYEHDVVYGWEDAWHDSFYDYQP